MALFREAVLGSMKKVMTMRDGWVWRVLVLGALLAAVPVRGADVDPAEVEKMIKRYEREAKKPAPKPAPKLAPRPAPKPAAVDPPENRRQPKPFPGEVDYKKLASPATNDQFIGKTVAFRVMFLSEWLDVGGYDLAGIPTKNLIFLDHRDVNSPVEDSGAFPPFPISVSSDQADVIHKLNKGDFILIKGQVEKPRPEQIILQNIPFDFARIYVSATEIKRLTSE